MPNLFQGNIREWLSKPFPFYENYKQKVLIPTVFSSVVMLGILLLAITKGWDILLNQLISVLTYGSVVILISLLFSLLLPAIFTQFFDVDKWTVKKTIIYLVLSVFTIALGVAILAYYQDNPNNIDVVTFFSAIFIRSITLSFFPIIVLVFLAEKRLYKKHNLQTIAIINDLQKHEQQVPSNKSFVFAKDTKDEISIAENQLLFVKAESNYCFLYFKHESSISTKLIRSSLKRIKEIVSTSTAFIRCHKSYIVNLEKVATVSGNAKGYLLHLQEGDYKIPVSRNRSNAILQSLKHN